MELTQTAATAMIAFEARTNICRANVKIHFDQGITEKLVLTFPREVGNKVITITPQELLLIKDLALEIQDSLKIDFLSDSIQQYVVPLINQGEKILAIKKLREISNMGLKDAKFEVEFMMEYGWTTWVSERRHLYTE